MPIELVRNDITRMRVDAIVNAANETLLGGGGVDGAIHSAAGPELLEECRRLHGCPVGEARITKGYRLPCRYVIHTVGPVWQGGEQGEEALLRSCYLNSLRLAAAYGCATVAFPLISSGLYAYPKEAAMRVAYDTVSDFLAREDETGMTVYIVVFDRRAFSIGEELYRDIRAYIDDVYVSGHGDDEDLRARRLRQYSAMRTRPAAPPPARALPEKDGEPKKEPSGPREAAPSPQRRRLGLPGFRRRTSELVPPQEPEEGTFAEESCTIPSKGAPSGAAMARARYSAPGLWDDAETFDPDRLSRLVDVLDESFAQMLFRKIDERNMTDVECYRRANIDRKLFSKIRSNPAYRPGKTTVLAFAVALELSLDETKEFLMKAGFALSHSSRFDVIVEYFISCRRYDIYQINEALFSFDQPLLGSV